MNRVRRWLACSFFFFLLLAAAVPLKSRAASGFAPDKGAFKILVNGQEIGTEQFDIGPNGTDWVARGTSEIHSPAGAMHVTGTLEFRDDGTPVRYDWSTQGAKKASETVTFNGAVASIELRVEGARPFTQTLTFSSPQVVILDNNLYHQYAVLAHVYDWQKKGPQTFSVLVPQENTPGTVTAESLGSQDVDGKKLDELSVKTEDLEVDVYLDAGRIARVVAPSSNAEIVRE
ncbi:MAG TPA: hypothetical protein VMB02_09915 [Candidatus Aquilonibacter sp.]|nr:hypothetical protein [Candidatus Aquilonibacter sp.]